MAKKKKTTKAPKAAKASKKDAKKTAVKKPKKHPLKAAFKKLGQKLRHPFDVILDLALAPGKLAVFAPLAPLAGTMAMFLKKKGVKVPGSKLDYPENLARQFYQVAILKGKPLDHGVGLADKHKAPKKGHLESLEHLQASVEHLNFLRNVEAHFRKSISHLEHIDVSAVQGAVSNLPGATGTSTADKLVDQGADAISKAGIVGSAAGAAIKIIHGIINFIKGMKKKQNAAKKGVATTLDTAANIASGDSDADVPDSTVLTPEEHAAIGDTPADPSLVSSADSAQDTMAANGMGNINSRSEPVIDGKVVKVSPTGEVDDYGTGIVGAVRRLFKHHPKHVDNSPKKANMEDASLKTNKNSVVGLPGLIGRNNYNMEDVSKTSNTNQTTSFISKPIDSFVVKQDDVKSKEPKGDLFHRAFASIKHRLHIDSLEHAEGKCEGHGCKKDRKKKHHKK